jgi:PEP-CTERM motif
MKTALCAAAIGATMLIGSGLPASSAPPGYSVTLEQVGSNVVATGSGAIDLAGLTFITSGPTQSEVAPTFATEATGGAGNVDEYSGATGPFSFGSGVFTSATTGTGDLVGIQVLRDGSGFIFVPTSYVSDSALSDTATYTGQTFSSLGATPGKYEWTWGSGANQTFTLEIGNAVPEPSTWAMLLLGFAGLGYAGYRKTRCDNALA